MVTVEQLWISVAGPVVAELLSSWQFTVALAGQVIVGAVTSCTVIVWSQLLDRNSVVEGKRVDVGGWRNIKKKKAVWVLASLWVMVNGEQLSVAVAGAVFA